ncbi:uncharacterized protein LOC110885350 [Helianthus annuus]|uniref:uncharacterized protein LOC110885350 n=1 Tax=Helianthus annuus TaxID=4232 RepID=UPI000B8FD93B|nr:uncharacterized protein LOC110885350 [Helianthus annuus]
MANKRAEALMSSLNSKGDGVVKVDEPRTNKIEVDNDIDEPTKGEKLAEMSPTKPPNVESAHLMLKQALQAEDDRSLLLRCLYTDNGKLIVDSIPLLNSCELSKLIEFLIGVSRELGI